MVHFSRDPAWMGGKPDVLKDFIVLVEMLQSSPLPVSWFGGSASRDPELISQV